MSQQVEIKLAVAKDGTPLLASHATRADGQPRFRLPLIRELINADPGVQYIVVREKFYGGYEANTRQFFDEHLKPGDVFVDVGAHWGVFSLSAATRWPGQVPVLAVEPHPNNISQLIKSVAYNGLQEQIEVVAAAAGAGYGIALLRCVSSMGHSLDETAAHAPQVPLHVPVIGLDDLIASRPALQDRRIFLKVDVEGFEHEVIVGARKLLAGGRVAAIMWEKGESYGRSPGLEKLHLLVEELKSHGFTLHRFPSSEYGGPLIPFAPTLEVGNVFALAPGFDRKPAYLQPFGLAPPFNSVFALPADPATRAETTRLLAEVHGSDGARWANPNELLPGAQARAAAATGWIPAGSRVLDLGAGVLALEQQLPAGCSYAPADLLARSATCRVVDLNQGQFPPGEYDVATMLELLEYLHDVRSVLSLARQCAARLVCTYHVRGAETVLERRQRGWFNDFSREVLVALFEQTGWRVDHETPHDFGTLFSCSANAAR